MLKVVLNDLLVNLKKRWVEVTIDIAFYIWASNIRRDNVLLR